jgi:predicted Rossmann fold nucleotide-binding protein DprA/Smf involved in DNA uptake
LERKYQHRTFRQAVIRAYANFAQKYPEWSASHFDEHFLTHDAAPLLLRVGYGVASTQGFALAVVWSRQMTWPREEIRQKLVAELTPIAADFLCLLETELPVQETVGQPIPQPA